MGLGYEWMRERGGGLAVISASWAGPKGKGMVRGAEGEAR